MLKDILEYGTNNPYELMNTFYKVGNETLLTLRNLSTKPENAKQPRTWNASELPDLVKVSKTTINKLISNNNDIPGIILSDNSKNKRFTLEAVNKLRELAGTKYKRPKNSETMILAVSNFKGGVGKTETAVDLSKKLAIEGLRTLLIDFDAQATATLISAGLIPDLELDYEDTITNSLLKDFNLIKDVIIPTHFNGLNLIPANLAIQDCDLMLPDDKQNNVEKLDSPVLRLEKALKLIKDDYDVIVIDCGPNLGMLTLNAICACNAILIPIPPSMSDYSSFVMYTSSLKCLFEEFPNKKLNYLRIVLTKHNGGNEALKMENMMRSQFGSYVLTNHMCETVEVLKAATDIGTVYDICKPSGSREAYKRAIQYLDNLNMEIINNFKEIWSNQSKQNIIKENQHERSEEICA
ncbi:MAG: AAA family ATPase [Rickettsiaceae bacterium]|nr:AAA family ATPase [Rickettsiaceae bacterium]